jgi:hypothetical protein
MYHIIELTEVMSSKIASRNTIIAIVFTIIFFAIGSSLGKQLKQSIINTPDK